MLRDDLQELFEKLILLLRKKLSLANSFIHNETEKIFCLKSNNLEQVIIILERDDELIQKINLADYEISELNREICKIIGIKTNELETFLKSANNEKAGEISGLNDQISSTFQILDQERERFIIEMEKSKNTLSRDMDNLRRIRKLNFEKEK